MNIFDFCMNDMKEAFEKGTIITEHGLEWGSIPQRDPYGTVHWNTDGIMMRMRAHRVAWVLANGPIPDNHVIDHDPSCPKSCVTVEHFLCITPSDHIRLGWERGEIKGGTFKNAVMSRDFPFEWQQETTCPSCGVWFVNHSQKQIYCSNECQLTDKEERRKLVRYPRPEVKICEQCDGEFTPKRVDSNFCSRECIEDDANSKKKERGRFIKTCLNPECQQEFTHNLERVQCCSKACATSLRHQERRINELSKSGTM